MSQHLTTYSFARLKITISFFLLTSLEYEMIVQQNVQAKTTATFGANHLRLYLIFVFNFPDHDIKIVQTLYFGYNLLEPLLAPCPYCPNYFPRIFFIIFCSTLLSTQEMEQYT